MRAKHPLKVHSIELISGEDQDMVDARPLNRPQVLPHRVSRPLVPLFAFIRLLRRKHLDESAAEKVEFVSLVDVPVETGRVELRQDVDSIEAAVEAIRDGNVDEAI